MKPVTGDHKFMRTPNDWIFDGEKMYHTYRLQQSSILSHTNANNFMVPQKLHSSSTTRLGCLHFHAKATRSEWHAGHCQSPSRNSWRRTVWIKPQDLLSQASTHIDVSMNLYIYKYTHMCIYIYINSELSHKESHRRLIDMFFMGKHT